MSSLSVSPGQGAAATYSFRRTATTPVAVGRLRRLVRKRTLHKTSERYSVPKFQQLDAYCARATSVRIATVLICVPLPGLAASVLPCALPLQDPAKGPGIALFSHLGWIAWCSTFGLLLTWVEVTDTPRTKYSLRQLAAMATLSTLLYIVSFALVVQHLVFPIPFSSIVGTVPLLASIAIAHLVIFGSRLWKDPAYWSAFRTYAPSVTLQMSQVVIYPAISVLFAGVSVFWQIALTLSFPLLKWALKIQLRRLSTRLKDCSVEVAVCGIEITASLYQSMIMQSSPTALTMAFIIGLDLAHGLIVIKVFMDKYTNALPRTISNSREPSTQLPSRQELIPFARQLLHSSKVTSDQAMVTICDRSTQVIPLPRSIALDDKRYMLTVALETLRVAEEVLLSEYFEVVVPFINSVIVVVAVQFPSARFNPRLAIYMDDPVKLATVMQSIVLYSILQGVTLLLFHWLLRLRYGISSMTYLAFILERHALSINGKMLAWLPFILHLSLVHYGNDFSFQFPWLDRDETHPAK